jgi:hypothetical protein
LIVLTLGVHLFTVFIRSFLEQLEQLLNKH